MFTVFLDGKLAGIENNCVLVSVVPIVKEAGTDLTQPERGYQQK